MRERVRTHLELEHLGKHALAESNDAGACDAIDNHGFSSPRSYR